VPIPYSHPWISALGPRLYKQTFPKLSSDVELEEFLGVLEANVATQRAPFAWVILADALLSSTAKQRKMFAAAEARMKEQDKKLCAGTAFVLTSAIARGAITAVYWLSPPVYPYTIVANEAAAVAWCESKLRESG
jgi:hypothetical protein